MEFYNQVSNFIFKNSSYPERILLFYSYHYFIYLLTNHFNYLSLHSIILEETNFHLMMNIHL